MTIDSSYHDAIRKRERFRKSFAKPKYLQVSSGKEKKTKTLFSLVDLVNVLVAFTLSRQIVESINDLNL